MKLVRHALGTASALFFGLGCATSEIPQEVAMAPADASEERGLEVAPMAPPGPDNAYLYYGYRDAAASPEGRMVFQDFSSPEGSLGGIWADPDSEHRGKSNAWARARVSRRSDEPFLAVDFAREGHGTNIRVIPGEGIPLPLEQGGQLLFDLRSADDVCVGLRMMERDGEIWAYGKPPLHYEMLCAPKDGSWGTYSVDLGPSAPWFRFPYDGNQNFGSGSREFDLMVSLTLELGFEGGDYMGEGYGRFDVKNFRITR